ncbi:MAG: 2-C-methyl-D-erythritol 4-phosphate cytidylyltransferase [Prevotella sp.]|nr:2-C-methyl-D-erythritol 4-phosphate cytidylyltransferase [Prevotella sp.]
MKQTDKNIIMITAGGVGARFGSSVPKQYVEINGRQVISYVIDACKQSQLADAILVVAHPNYHEELTAAYGVDVVASGPELNVTKRNGLDYICRHTACEKLVVVDAVRPAVETHVIDRFFTLLDEYDAVACAHKITDSLGRYGEWIVNREEYYTLSTPEGFRFPLIDRHFKADSPLTESIQQLPPTSKVYLDFDAPYYDKLTYPEDLFKIQSILSRR